MSWLVSTTFILEYVASRCGVLLTISMISSSFFSSLNILFARALGIHIYGQLFWKKPDLPLQHKML